MYMMHWYFYYYLPKLYVMHLSFTPSPINFHNYYQHEKRNRLRVSIFHNNKYLNTVRKYKRESLQLNRQKNLQGAKFSYD